MKKTQEKAVVLKPGRDKAIRQRHHWIFSGAVASYPSYDEGDLLPVVSDSGELLGTAYFNRRCSIVGRMVAFGTSSPHEAIKAQLEKASCLRSLLFDPEETNAYRLVNGEGDLLPGLIVDRYGDCLVVQFSTLGMDKLRDVVVEQLQQLIQPRSIVERSTGPSRREEGLSDAVRGIAGEPVEQVPIRESGLSFVVDVLKGQKTGFFLDHREMRRKVEELAKGKKVLNAFAYTGGFTVYALRGGALKVDSVDISQEAMAQAEHHVALNGHETQAHGFFVEDVFRFLRERELNYDLVILDPPAFAKKKKDVVAACRGYKDINRLALQKMPRRSLLLTSSCSYFVDETLFQQVLFQSAVEAHREVKILGRYLQPADHPVNLCHPEGHYLKSFLLYVD